MGGSPALMCRSEAPSLWTKSKSSEISILRLLLKGETNSLKWKR
jgi:hypothetical protein